MASRTRGRRLRAGVDAGRHPVSGARGLGRSCDDDDHRDRARRAARATDDPSGAPRAADGRLRRRDRRRRCSTRSTTPSCTASPAWASASTCSPRWSSLVLGLGAVYAFPRLRPAARAALAFFFGALAIVNGAMHVKHIAAESAGRERRHGRPRPRRRRRARRPGRRDPVAAPRRGRRPAAAGAGPTASPPSPPGCCSPSSRSCPIGTAITETHKFREHVGAPPSADYREVAFDASDGVHLSGWYRPTRNGATLLVIHGGGGDRTGAVAHAKLLVRHGYGVLLYDARGRGRSEGQQNAFGWGWTKDVAGAIAFLKSRPEVDPAAHRRPRPLDRRRRAGPGRRAGGGPPRRGRRRRGRRVLRGLAAPAGHHRDDADLRRRVRDRPDHLGREVRPADGGHDQAHHRAAAARLRRPQPRSTSSTSSTTAPPAAAPSSTGTCPTRATPARSATRRPRTSAA